MGKVQIWHNPSCSKSRQGMAYLNEKQCDIEVFEYKKTTFAPKTLEALIKSSDQPLSDFVRTNEPEFKSLGLDLNTLTPETFAEIAAEYPKLLQRPIIIKDGKAVIARPISKIDELLG